MSRLLFFRSAIAATLCVLTGCLGACSQADRGAQLDSEPALVVKDTQRLPRTSSAPGGAVPQSAIPLGPAPEGLRLVLNIEGNKAVFEQGARVPVSAKLGNASDRPISVVLPGDGSFKGWREPRVHFTAESNNGGGFKPMAGHPAIPSCGMYDENWQDDVKTLPPHSETAVSLWSSPNHFLNFDDPGTVRLTAHYEYAAGKGRQSGGPVPALLKDTPPFELLSNAVEFRIEKRLELTLEAIGPVESGEGSRLDNVLAVRLHNLTSQPREISSPFSGHFGDGSLSFNVNGVDDAPTVVSDSEVPAAVRKLAGGETITLLGPGAVFNSAASHWVVAKPKRVQIQAEYRRSQDNYTLRSNWVTVEVR